MRRDKSENDRYATGRRGKQTKFLTVSDNEINVAQKERKI